LITAGRAAFGVRGLRVVLNNLSEQIRECLEHAVDCARQAAAQTDPKIIGSFELFGILAFMVMLYFLLPIYDRLASTDKKTSERPRKSI
jgi:hypothetical protein